MNQQHVDASLFDGVLDNNAFGDLDNSAFPDSSAFSNHYDVSGTTALQPDQLAMLQQQQQFGSHQGQYAAGQSNVDPYNHYGQQYSYASFNPTDSTHSKTTSPSPFAAHSPYAQPAAFQQQYQSNAQSAPPQNVTYQQHGFAQQNPSYYGAQSQFQPQQNGQVASRVYQSQPLGHAHVQTASPAQLQNASPATLLARPPSSNARQSETSQAPRQVFSPILANAAAFGSPHVSFSAAPAVLPLPAGNQQNVFAADLDDIQGAAPSSLFKSKPATHSLVSDVLRRHRTKPMERAEARKQLAQHLAYGSKPFQLTKEYEKILKAHSARDGIGIDAHNASSVGTPAEISSDDDSSEDEVGPSRAATRPEDPAEAAAWDAIGMVELTTRSPTSTQIGAAVADFGKLIRKLMDDLGPAKDQFKETKKQGTEAPSFVAAKQELSRKLNIVYHAIEAAHDHGDEVVLTNLGGNQRLLSSLVSALIQSHNLADHNGKGPRACLQLLANITTIDKDMLKNLNFPTIEPRFKKNGDEEIKQLLKQIVDNAEKRSASAAAAPATTSTDRPPAGAGPAKTVGSANGVRPAVSLLSKTANANAKPVAASATSANRPLIPGMRQTSAAAPGAGSSKTPTTKTSGAIRIPATAGAAPSVANKSVATPGAATASKPDSKTTTVPAAKSWAGTGGLLPGKMRKIVKTVPEAKKAEPNKPTNGTASSTPILRAIKRDAPHDDAGSKDEAPPAKKVSLQKTEVAPSASKLGDLLAEITKPVQQASVPVKRVAKKEVKLNETPEETKRRLRKEARRGLRVSWKADDELEEVREFHSLPGEHERHIRDASDRGRDEKGEGAILKKEADKLRAHQAEIDEEDSALVDENGPWQDPVMADFSMLSEGVRQVNYTDRAGLKAINTEEQKVTAAREQRELMVVYTDFADIPPTPKSPLHGEMHKNNGPTGRSIGLSDDQPIFSELHQRRQDRERYPPDYARQAMQYRMSQQTTALNYVDSQRDPRVTDGPHDAPSYQNVQAPKPKDEQVFAVLSSDRVKKWQDAGAYDAVNHPRIPPGKRYDSSEVQAALEMVQYWVELLKLKPGIPTEPPAHVKDDPIRSAEWWHGHNKDKQRKEEQQRVANQSQAAHAGQYAAYGQQQPVQPAPPVAQAPQYAATQIPPPFPPVPPAPPAIAPTAAVPPGADAAAWLQWAAQIQAQQQSQQQVIPPPPPPQAYGQYAGTANNDAMQQLLAALGGGAQQSQQQPTQPLQTAQEAQQQLQQQAYQQYWQQYYQQQAQQQQPQAQQHSARDDDDIPPHLRGIKRDKIGTRTCIFWKNNSCTKGDKCTFRHSDD